MTVQTQQSSLCNVASVVKTTTQERTSSKIKTSKKKNKSPSPIEEKVTINLMSSRDSAMMDASQENKSIESLRRKGGAIELNPSHFGCLNITSIKKQNESKESFANYATLGQCPQCISLEQKKNELEEEVKRYKAKAEEWKK